MKNRFFIAFFYLFTSFYSFSQTELGLFAGISNYTGDLAGNGKKRHFEVLEYHPAFGLFWRTNPNKWYAVKLQGVYGMISGSDLNANDLGRRLRNLSFRSDIIELSAQAEFNILAPWLEVSDNFNTPYLFGGLGVFYFNPQAKFGNQWYYLQPLGTEGQAKGTQKLPYRLFEIAMPLGFGFRYDLEGVANIGLEIGYRFTLSDYLDDVSKNYPDIKALFEKNPLAAKLSYRMTEVLSEQSISNPVGMMRGNKQKRDGYIFMGLNFSINLSPRKYKY